MFLRRIDRNTHDIDSQIFVLLKIALEPLCLDGTPRSEITWIKVQHLIVKVEKMCGLCVCGERERERESVCVSVSV